MRGPAVDVPELCFPGILDSADAVSVAGNPTACQNFEGLRWFRVAQRGVGRAVPPCSRLVFHVLVSHKDGILRPRREAKLVSHVFRRWSPHSDLAGQTQALGDSGIN